ncbi:MAG: 16S rRNA (uracil(1498)-N(3))-methyltransferase [Thermogutta sp.]|uniref:16S rRNA (uracil(1498)-N(3))-methyltransferase n=1 Tax=Thermogutta sp. TaxID=1962930 RepID=UPI0019AF2A55|nr:16S rRNA (uracil(1498)-N(3))-methyltransferase [Thermogutta sp.]MBC7354470.1 16S rRNA (uracil(1498)-N(3))-methyltransferase [Thermogutta sp.]
MAERFYCPTVTGTHVVLEGSEAHHLIHVMRAAVGDRVILFDGQGHEYLCEVEKISKRDATLQVLERRTIDRELPFSLTVATPLPKGDRQRVLVEKLTELGVTAFVPLITERTVVRPEKDIVIRLTRIVIEASKQCGRNRLMMVAEPQPWSSFLEAVNPAAARYLAHPVESGEHERFGASQKGTLFLDEKEERGPIVIAIGPEGGFTSAEMEAARTRGWHLLDLGPRILRVETAAIALAALFGISRQITRWG